MGNCLTGTNLLTKILKMNFQYCRYSVGYPHGGPHITLHTTGNLGGYGGDGAGAGIGAGAGHGHGHDGKYVAANRGAVHVAPLVGHIQSVSID